MAYQDYSSAFALDDFFTYLNANQFGANDEHIIANFSTEHNWDSATANGTHKWGVIATVREELEYTFTLTTPGPYSSYTDTWMPPAGLYQFAVEFGYSYWNDNSISMQILINGVWRYCTSTHTISGVPSSYFGGLFICDGTNLRLNATTYSSGVTFTIYYQKF